MSASREVKPSKEVLYLNFNQTTTSLSVGTRSGFTLYDFYSVYECQCTFDSLILTDDIKDVCIIERNYETSLVAYVLLSKPRNLVLYNISKGELITEKLFPNAVLSVRLNRVNVVVCLEETIYVLSLSAISDNHTHVITGTPPNAKGLIALSSGCADSHALADENNTISVLAYPSSVTQGDVQLFDALHMHAKITIPAHTSPIAALTLDEQGEKLATASIKGTVIRVFSVSTGYVLFNFRRGVKRCVEIQYLSFSRDPELLCASSNTETIHIFQLIQPVAAEHPQPVEEGWLDMFGRVLTQTVNLLPTQMSDVLTQQRSFAHAHLPVPGHKTIGAVIRIKDTPYVVVASHEGVLYIYDINMEQGGACQLVKQHRIEGPLEDKSNQSNSTSSLDQKNESPEIQLSVNTTDTQEMDNSTQILIEEKIISHPSLNNQTESLCDEGQIGTMLLMEENSKKKENSEEDENSKED